MSNADEIRALSPRFTEALTYAVELHARQWKKGTEIPYASHLLGTCATALEYGADEDAAIAALLHDAIEDHGAAVADVIRERFGARVAAIVDGCSDSAGQPRPPWRERKEAYVAHLAEADAATVLVSASDKLDNARRILADIRSESAAGRDGSAVWARFKAGREGQLWYLRSLVEAFRANPQHEPQLIDELDRTVTAIEVEADGGARSDGDPGMDDPGSS